MNPLPFAGRVAVVTGGAQGIGEGVVEVLHARGARVAVWDIAVEAGVALVERLNASQPGSALFSCVDVSDEAVVAGAHAEALRAFGVDAVDVLVVMSAVFVYGEVHLVCSEAWDSVLGVNIKGAAHALKAVLPGMRAARRGAVVLTSSITGSLCFPAFVPYSATKAALEQMTRDVALDCGAFGREGRPVEDLVAELARDVSLRRMGRVDECARAVAFLASDEASYISGATLAVDGGFSRK